MNTYIEPLTYRDGTKRIHTGVVRDLERAFDEYSIFVANHGDDPMARHLALTAQHILEELTIRAERESHLGRANT